jgi:hypothetical protein
VGPKSSLDGCEEYSPRPESIPGPSNLVAIPVPVDTVVNLTVSRGILLDNLIGYQLLMWILFRIIDYQTFKVDEDLIINS